MWVHTVRCCQGCNDMAGPLPLLLLLLLTAMPAYLTPTPLRRNKCLEDLQSTTRYVTWSLHTKSRASLKSMLSKVRRATCFAAVPAAWLVL